MSNLPCLRSLILLSLTTSLAQAASNGLLLGTDAPPASIGGYSLTPFLPDVRPEFDLVSEAPSPLGGSVGFDLALDHLIVPFSWGSWSHDYEGDVYAFPVDAVGSPDFSLTFLLPADTTAFVFYAEPVELAVFDFTAFIPGGPDLASPIDGDGGAIGFGFYADPGETLGSIIITSSVPFAVGEFSIASIEPLVIPEAGTGTASLLLAAVAGGTWLRRRNRA